MRLCLYMHVEKLIGVGKSGSSCIVACTNNVQKCFFSGSGCAMYLGTDVMAPREGVIIECPLN